MSDEPMYRVVDRVEVNGRYLAFVRRMLEASAMICGLAVALFSNWVAVGVTDSPAPWPVPVGTAVAAWLGYRWYFNRMNNYYRGPTERVVVAADAGTGEVGLAMHISSEPFPEEEPK